MAAAAASAQSWTSTAATCRAHVYGRECSGGVFFNKTKLGTICVKPSSSSSSSSFQVISESRARSLELGGGGRKGGGGAGRGHRRASSAVSTTTTASASSTADGRRTKSAAAEVDLEGPPDRPWIRHVDHHHHPVDDSQSSSPLAMESPPVSAVVADLLLSATAAERVRADSQSEARDSSSSSSSISSSSLPSSSSSSSGTVGTPTMDTKPSILKAVLYGDFLEVQHGSATLRVDKRGRLELRQFRRKTGKEELVVHGQLKLPPHSSSSPEFCKMVVPEDEGGIVVVKWSEDAVLRVVPAGSRKMAKVAQSENGSRAWTENLEEGFVLDFTVRRCKGVLEMAEVTLDIRSAGHWFGGGHFMKQHWPLNRGAFEVGPFFPFDNGPNGLNTLATPQWVTSKGLLVLADADIPFLHVGMNAPRPGPYDGWIQRSWGVGVQNLSKEYLPLTCRGNGDGMLRLQARHSYKCHRMNHPLHDWIPNLSEFHESSDGTRKLTVRFALCAHQNVRDATMAALGTLKKPPNPPPKELVTKPIWTTWARYHAKVTQAKVEQFANEIASRQLQRSVMEIDDKWQTKYGDFVFDPVKFPNPKAMVELLHALGFKVTLWIMPFAEESSLAYKEGGPKGYFISSDAPPTRGLKPGFFRWWQPTPAVALDVTNPDAVKWFVTRLKKLQEENLIDGFKFDAGEPCFLPRRFRTHTPIISPIEYTRLWVQEVASNFEVGEVRTGHRTTSVPLLTRMGDRFSHWGSGNGLRSVIPTLLTSGLLGYPFCLPDMIGGNAYFGSKPDMELLVRWAQANALMPAMQFSIPPWDFSAEAEKLCHSALQVRRLIQNHLLMLADDACRALAPICRPMWWLDPEDDETFPIGDQFAIGDDVIVAPVVVKGQKRRDVYLTRGFWCDLVNPQEVYEGPRWLRNLEAPLNKLPVFKRVDPSAVASHIASQLIQSGHIASTVASQLVAKLIQGADPVSL
ncbi:hypothetical protein CBR_g36951 [Chara braunii]|uniref:Glycoside hydrolase family 31 N-terminal domain-containing protein n=1 Tax=Chara braunii TaxID=69332 RepID=A0A388JZG9_CHABU|nr:hypothetical protein CBR_g36951 [Chara braunii]|eukprot:GBG63182.1 hypothetical protein CBR_g36951 [Chara braunii]